MNFVQLSVRFGSAGFVAFNGVNFGALHDGADPFFRVFIGKNGNEFFIFAFG